MTSHPQISVPTRGPETLEDPEGWGSFSLATPSGSSNTNPNPKKEEGSVHV